MQRYQDTDVLPENVAFQLRSLIKPCLNLENEGKSTEMEKAGGFN